MTNQVPVSDHTSIAATNDITNIEICNHGNNINEMDSARTTISSMLAKVHFTTDGDGYCCASSSCLRSSSIPQQQTLSSSVSSIQVKKHNFHTNEEGDDEDIEETADESPNKQQLQEVISKHQHILLPPNELIKLFAIMVIND